MPSPLCSEIRAKDKAKSPLGCLLDDALENEHRQRCDAEANADFPACTRRDVAPPMDAFVCDHVLSSSLCQRLVEQSEAMGYSFWHPNGNAAEFRSADTVEVIRVL